MFAGLPGPALGRPRGNPVRLSVVLPPRGPCQDSRQVIVHSRNRVLPLLGLSAAHSLSSQGGSAGNLPSALHLAPITSQSCFRTAHPSALVPPALMLFPGQQNHVLLRLSHWPSLNAFPQSARVAGSSPPARPLAITPFNKLTALPFLHQRSFLP